MADYIVMVDNEESSELADVISITGRVNGTNCAAKVRVSKIKSLSPREQKREKQKALIEGYLGRAEQAVVAGGEKVTL